MTVPLATRPSAIIGARDYQSFSAGVDDQPDFRSDISAIFDGTLDCSELLKYPRRGQRQSLATRVWSGATPVLPAAQLGEIGCSLVIFPGALVRALVFVARERLGVLRAEGTTASYWERMVMLAGINQAVGAEALLKQGQAYDPDIGGWGLLAGS